MLNVKKTLTKIMSNLPTLVVETVSSNSVNINANSASESSFSVAKSGYIPLGIIGYNIAGTGISAIAPYRIRLIDSTAYYGVRNYGSGQATGVSVQASVLYVKWGGGYFITSFMSTFSRLAERWWEYVERKENAYSSNGESELLNRIAIEKRNSKRGKFGIGGCSAAEHKESDRLGRSYLFGDRFSEHGFVGVRDAECRDKRINHESFYDNKNHNGLCEIYRSRFIATTSERGWACA